MARIKALTDLIRRVGYALIIIGGFILIAVGILGLFLPVLPGWALIIAGLVILGEETWLSRFIINKLPGKIRERFQDRNRAKS